MSEIGSLLELLNNAHDDVGSVRLTTRDWSLPRRRSKILVDQRGQLRWEGRGPWPAPFSFEREIWFEAPDRLRVERRGVRSCDRLGIRNGTLWWCWVKDEGTATGDTRLLRRGPRLPRLLDPPLLAPARLVGMLKMTATGSGYHLGREVVRAVALPRVFGYRSEIHCDLAFDAEHGTLLRSETYDGHTCVQVTEVLAVSYGDAIPRERFTFGEPAADACPGRLAAKDS